jgi:hypothetical protein
MASLTAHTRSIVKLDTINRALRLAGENAFGAIRLHVGLIVVTIIASLAGQLWDNTTPPSFGFSRRSSSPSSSLARLASAASAAGYVPVADLHPNLRGSTALGYLDIHSTPEFHEGRADYASPLTVAVNANTLPLPLHRIELR